MRGMRAASGCASLVSHLHQKPGIRRSKNEKRKTKTETREPNLETRNLRAETKRLDVPAWSRTPTQNPKPQNRNPKTDTRNSKPEISDLGPHQISRWCVGEPDPHSTAPSWPLSLSLPLSVSDDIEVMEAMINIRSVYLFDQCVPDSALQ